MIENFEDFENHVANLFRTYGFEVQKAKRSQKGYDLVVKKDKISGIVQVKWLKGNVQTPQVLKFVDFLANEADKQFNCGFFITSSGFGRPAEALIKSWGKDAKVFCGIASDQTIKRVGEGDELLPPPPPPLKRIYFGVFTAKGGVGKTTIAAHLAGAFLLQNFDIVLVDLDPEQNLKKLVGDGIYLENPGKAGNTIVVFNSQEWDEETVRDCEIVICDCSPALERNPRELIEKLDYCIIPTTLNPLGISKHGNVIKQTVRELRSINKNAHLFVIINNYKKTISTKQLGLLKKAWEETYQDISKTDEKFHCVDPDEACIRSSDQLYYWGIHLLENSNSPRSELAFKLVGGRCYPREDFLRLADYILSQSDLAAFRT